MSCYTSHLMGFASLSPYSVLEPSSSAPQIPGSACDTVIYQWQLRERQVISLGLIWVKKKAANLQSLVAGPGTEIKIHCLSTGQGSLPVLKLRASFLEVLQ